MNSIDKFLRNNGLAITFFCLFVCSFVGQSVSGLFQYNDQVRHSSKLGYWQYLGTGNFLEGVFVNWQAAMLQLACLILLGSFLILRGASHSRKPDDSSTEHENIRGEGSSWQYRHSFLLFFLAAFFASFLAHIIFGSAAYNEKRALTNGEALPPSAYPISAQFWFETFQTWQAEFLAIALFIVASIFLRGEGSPESKPVEASDEETGETDK